MDSWICWLILAVVLVVIELSSQMVWTLCLAVGCLGAIVADLCDASIAWQIAVMAIASVVAFIVLMPLFKRWHDASRHHRQHAEATGMSALCGRRSRLITDILPGQKGRMRIDGDNWQVMAPGSTSILAAGTEVVVTGHDGNILFVSQINDK